MPSEIVLVQDGDEGLHPPENDPLWSESFYLSFSDSEGRLGGFTRIAFLPSKTEGLLCLYLPEGAVGIVLESGRPQHPKSSPFRVVNLEHECIEPLKRWRIRFNGDVNVFADAAEVGRSLEPDVTASRTLPVEIDLEVSGLHTPFFYPDYRKVATPPPHRKRDIGWMKKVKRALRRPHEIRMALRARSGRHYEQSMVVHGTITLNGQKHPFNGTGHRDHSWGLRDWSLSPRFRWLSGQVEGLAFNAMYLTVAGTHATNGYVCHNGRCAPVDELRLESSFDDTGLGGRHLSLELSSGGERFSIMGDVFLNVPLPIVGPGFHTMYTVGRTRYQWGDRVGYGVAEFLERLEP
jgi:hypothetical protein